MFDKENINKNLNSKRVQNLNSFEMRKKPRLNNYLKEVGANDSIVTRNANGGLTVIDNQSFTPTKQNVVVVAPQGIANAVARFNLSISRPTANIDAILPVPVFGALDYKSDYVDVITPYLPANVTYTIARTADRKSLAITYTAPGPLVDIVTISVKEKPYLSLLEGTKGSLIKLSQIKAKIFDAANEEQFSEMINLVINSLFGNNSDNKFTADDYLRDDQYVQTMRTITQDLDIDQERTLIINMSPLADNDITFTTTVSKFDTARSTGF